VIGSHHGEPPGRAEAGPSRSAGVSRIRAHLLRRDSTYGPLDLPVTAAPGRFRTRDALAGRLKAGARKVLLSAPGKGLDDFLLAVGERAVNAATHGGGGGRLAPWCADRVVLREVTILAWGRTKLLRPRAVRH
jgi:hypothetical protein